VNTLNARPLIRTLGALLLGIAAAGLPAMSYADHGGGGGHSGGGGGGGHFGGGGGGHFSAGGGGHFSGGAHYSGGGHFGGYSGAGHYVSRSGAFVGGSAAGAHYYSGARGYAAAHYGAGYTAGRVTVPAGARGSVRTYAGRPFHPGAGRAWAGGYWRGVYWPRCWYYPGFAWFLPVLPFGYATYWWGGEPYYYWDNLYYTWSPADDGYVVTTPPPAGGDQPDESGTAGPPADTGADVYLYPRNGQSDEQMANDRYECHSWAAGQTGFDPTRGGQQAGNRDDYRRAMISCLDARGYSAR
jgi:hypothetical protein